MKLLLTSAGWSESPVIGKEFLKLVGKKPSEIKIFLVVTPIKYLKRNKYILQQFTQFKGVKIPEKNVTFFKLDRKATPDDLKNIDVIFVFGGNTFEYLDRIRKTGLDKLIKNFVRKGGIYLGLSAGSYVACPTIEAANWKHADNNLIGLKNLKGLNFVPFLITAHLEEELRPIIKQAAENTKYKVIALTDEQAVLVKDNYVKIIGKGKKNIFNDKNLGDVKIRLAESIDLKIILKLNNLLDPEEKGKKEKIKEAIDKKLVWIAVLDKKVVGYVLVRLLDKNHEQLPSSVFISDLYVVDSRRGQGIGKMLIQKALAKKYSKQYKYFSLTHDPKEKSLTSFYKNFGFKMAGKTKVGNIKMIKKI